MLILVLVAALSQLGIQTTTLIAAVGAIGLAIGLALQSTLSNIAAGIMLGLALSVLATYWLSRTATRLIGGQTGDILGAAQQLGEIAIYLGLAIVIGWGGQ